MTKLEQLVRTICIRDNRCFNVSPVIGNYPVVTCVATRIKNSGDEIEIELIEPYDTDGIKDASTITVKEADVGNCGGMATFTSVSDGKKYLLTTFA